MSAGARNWSLRLARPGDAKAMADVSLVRGTQLINCVPKTVKPKASPSLYSVKFFTASIATSYRLLDPILARIEPEASKQI